MEFAAAEAHRARWMALLGCVVAQAEGWLLVAHPTLQWPLFNYAAPVAPAPPAAPAAAWLAVRDRLPCFLTPDAAPPAPGLALLEEQAVLGAAAAPAAAAPVPAGMKVWPLPPALAPLWVDLMLDAFGIPAALRPPVAAAWAGAAGRLAPGERLELYLAEADGSPAGTGALFVDAHGTAGLYGGAVLPEFRGRGLAGALAAQRLAAAFRAGARAALTQTQPGGGTERTWRRLGYGRLYSARVWSPAR